MTDNRAWRGTRSIAVFGRRAVLEALDAAREGHVSVCEVRFARDTPRAFRTDVRDACRAAGVEAVETSLRDVHELSRDARHDQGAAALIELVRVVDVEAFAADLHGPRAARPTRLIALDGVTNPQNVGMIVRSALASGMSGILWPMEGAPWVSGLIIKASAGTVFRSTIVTCGTTAEGLAALRTRGFQAAGLIGSGKVSLFDHTPTHRAVYVVGSEAEGISPTVHAELDQALAIPMRGDVESLNAAVAAGVLCFWVAAAGAQQAR